MITYSSSISLAEEVTILSVCICLYFTNTNDLPCFSSWHSAKESQIPKEFLSLTLTVFYSKLLISSILHNNFLPTPRFQLKYTHTEHNAKVNTPNLSEAPRDISKLTSCMNLLCKNPTSFTYFIYSSSLQCSLTEEPVSLVAAVAAIFSEVRASTLLFLCINLHYNTQSHFYYHCNYSTFLEGKMWSSSSGSSRRQG